MAVHMPRVALVDDDASVRTALARLLSALSMHATAYASAREFLDSLDSGLPDCLVVDLHMPEVSGLELQLRLAAAGASIPTIVISAHNDAVMRDRCLQAGAICYLPKPLEAATLTAQIREAIALRNQAAD